jgi:hypothetical protein
VYLISCIAIVLDCAVYKPLYFGCNGVGLVGAVLVWG